MATSPQVRKPAFTAEALRQRLGESVGVEFCIVDPLSGKVLAGSPLLCSGQLIDTARREDVQEPAILHEPAPLSTLTARIQQDQHFFLAVAPFLSEAKREIVSVSDIAGLLKLGENAAADWLRSQEAWREESLLRLANLAVRLIEAEAERDQRACDVESISEKLCDAYEDLAVVYTTVERLQASNSMEHLFSLVAEHLLEALSAEAIHVHVDQPEGHSRTGEVDLGVGLHRLDRRQIASLPQVLKLADSTPVVINPPRTNESCWQFPDVKNLILTRIAFGERNLGWIGAFNHTQGGWFGSDSVRLLHTVGTLLGMRMTVEAVNALRHDAELASAAKSAFLANISHEFRTPLNGILSFSRLLTNDSYAVDESERQEYMQTIGDCATRLLDMINDILELSRLETQRGRVTSIPCMINEIVAGVAFGHRDRAAAKGLRLETKGLDTSMLCIHSDPVRLRQLLTYLVRNAIKFTEEGEIRLQSRLIQSESGQRLRIEVCDSGIGIPPEKLERIFESFVQADNSSTRRYGGIGLGLSLCQRLAESLGGVLHVQSDVGVGSIFTVEFDAQSVLEEGNWEDDLLNTEADTALAAPGKGLDALITE